MPPFRHQPPRKPPFSRKSPQKLYVVFLNKAGEITLNPGEKIVSVKRVDSLFRETVDAAGDLTVSENKITLSPRQ